ncbi:hypothetical protein KL930_001706 [Ogataea haglerorum]|nr:hypothetical protein KL922_003949 [Ogataea haglerorum]KAG7780784.1 hypothetical protein KL930_001706 [Ogataea haglerorum]
MSKFESSFSKRKTSDTGSNRPLRPANESQDDLVSFPPSESIQYDMGPSLEDGYKDKLFASTVPSDEQEMSTSTSSPRNNLHSVLQPPLVPSMGLVDDPLHYLKNQEIVVTSRLLATIDKHRASLQKGSRRVGRTRELLLNLFSELNQISQAMKEIYTTEQHNKIAVLTDFEHWEAKRTKIVDRIDEIENRTSEGAAYKSLLAESDRIGTEIEQLEHKLRALRAKQKQVNQQLRESKSLLDIKLNAYYESLSQIEAQEFNEIEKLLPVKGGDKQLNPASIIENYSLQLRALADMVHTAEARELSFHECCVYLEDVFGTLGSLEAALQKIIADTVPEKTELLLKELAAARRTLEQRRQQAAQSKLGFIEAIIGDEITAIENAVRTIRGEEPKPLLKTSASATSVKSARSVNSPSPSALPIKPAFSVPVASTSQVTAGSSEATNYAHAKSAFQKSKGDKKD